jgi:hypothetical protein
MKDVPGISAGPKWIEQRWGFGVQRWTFCTNNIVLVGNSIIFYEVTVHLIYKFL